MKQDMFEDFLGKEVKIPYKDESSLKVARGVLSAVDDKFVKVTGSIGTIIINKDHILKISLKKENEEGHHYR